MFTLIFKNGYKQNQGLFGGIVFSPDFEIKIVGSVGFSRASQVIANKQSFRPKYKPIM